MTFKPSAWLALLALFSSPLWAKTELTSMIEQALTLDSTREQIYSQSQAIRENGIASATLSDPKIKVGVGNLPIDSFQFDDDPMTSVSVGLMQEFGRGETLELQKKMANRQADGTAVQIQTRELDVANSITQLWAELVYQQHAQQIILENKKLVKELVRFIDTNYSMGRGESQDLLQAKVQVSKLDDQLQKNRQTQHKLKAQLSEWLGEGWYSEQKQTAVDDKFDWHNLDRLLANQSGLDAKYHDLLMMHPSIKVADANIKANQVKVEIADESYSPKFGVEVMYAHRESNGMDGQPASDLMSAYLTMDIPLFTDKRQDRQYAAAQLGVGAAKSARDVMLKQMNAKVNALVVDRENLMARINRYQETIIDQSNARLKAVERGYQNNTAQFNDVVTAIRDKLALSLEMYRLEADLNITNSNLAYLLNRFSYHVDAPSLAQTDR